jgi:hypothetical protein
LHRRRIVDRRESSKWRFQLKTGVEGGLGRSGKVIDEGIGLEVGGKRPEAEESGVLDILAEVIWSELLLLLL